MASPDFTESVDITFHGVPYILCVSTYAGSTLSIQVEQKHNADEWKGEFEASYVEDISAKTGSFKKFAVFVKMLLSGLKGQSDSVFLDLLTYQDLEALRSKKAGASSAPSSSTAPRAIAPSNKRYFIVTYAAEFDRVHYPLPLQYDESPSAEKLKATIIQLRRQVDQLQRDVSDVHVRAKSSGEGSAMEARRLREENGSLRAQLKEAHELLARRLHGGGDDTNDGGEGREVRRELKQLYKERELLTSRMAGLEAELERQGGLHRRELRRKAKEAQEAASEAAAAQATVRDLRLQVRQLQLELEASKRRRSGSALAAAAGPPLYYKRSAVGAAALPSGGSRQAGRALSSGRAPPAGARMPSSGGSRASSRDASPASKRPSSAPPGRGGRFDPTEYVRQKRERDQLIAARLQRHPMTPPRPGFFVGGSEAGGSSAAGSRRGSAHGSRAESPAGRLVAAHAPASPAGQRRPWGSNPSSRPGSSNGRPAAPPVRQDSPARPAALSGGSHAWSKFPTAAERAASPGKALQDVKQRLSDYVAAKSPSAVVAVKAPPAASPPPPAYQQASYAAAGASLSPSSYQPTSPSPLHHGSYLADMSLPSSQPAVVLDDATVEIADIDKRLQALQTFLKAAKGSSTSAAPMAASVETAAYC